MSAGTFRDWGKGGSHVVFADLGLKGCLFPGRSWSQVADCSAYANAVVDDFGNLVIVGRWS